MKKNFTINAPARIHIGFLDLDKNSNRKYGSLGLTISDFSYKIKIENSNRITVNCRNQELKSKIKKIINAFNKKKKILGCKITVLNEIPIHRGLGSGTQLALSVGYLISKLNKIRINTDQMAINLSRGIRSGIGIESFKYGGFNVDVGKLKGSFTPPLNILNIKWPKKWKILLILDTNLVGTHGKKEDQEFRDLKKINISQVNLNCKSLLMNIIPGLIEKNFDEFSKGLRVIQNNMSKIFYGNVNKFASNAIEQIFMNLKKKGIISFGQSSWGPTGFIFFENSKKRNQLLKYIEKYISLNKISGLELLKVEGRNSGKKLNIKENV